MELTKDTELYAEETNTFEQQISYKERDQALIKKLIEKEARLASLENEQTEYDKHIKHIQQSKSWKLMKPVRRFVDWLMRLFGRKQVREQKHRSEEHTSELQS